MSKGVLLRGTGVNVFEIANLFALRVLMDFSEFPAKVHIDSSLMAFLESNFVSVGEFIDPLVWSEICDSCGGTRETLNLILSQE